MSENTGPLCGPDSVSYYPATQELSKLIFIFACVINVINSVLSVVGNTVILSALRQCQSLHLPSKALLCSLALTDLVVGLVVLPLFITHHLTIILEMPTYYCTIAILYTRTSLFVASSSLFTVLTIAAERYLAFRLRLRYRELVTFKRVVSILSLVWIISALWAVLSVWSVKVHMLIGALGLFSCCLAVPLCYLTIHRGLRRHIANVHHQPGTSEPDNFNVLRYNKTVTNMMWIYGFLLVCYIPFLSSMLVTLFTSLNNTTRFTLQFSPIAVYFNSCLNPVLYCWRIKELKQKVIAYQTTLCSVFFSSH